MRGPGQFGRSTAPNLNRMQPFYLKVTFLLCVDSTVELYQTVISAALALPGLVLIVLSRKKSLITTTRSRKLILLIGFVLLLLGLSIYSLRTWCR